MSGVLDRPVHAVSQPLAVTIGEPAGIGLDTTIMAWRERVSRNVPPFYLLGDPDYLKLRGKAIGIDVPVEVVQPAHAVDSFRRALPVVRLDVRATAIAGQPDSSSAAIAIESIRRAVADVFAGHCSAIVTNPVSKNVLYGAGFADPGHTEFLANLAADKIGQPVQPVMMLWSPALAVVPVTIHIPLKDVPARVTPQLIVTTGRIVARELSSKFGIVRPRLVIAGLNPHAGESGMLGDEDIAIIAPAVRQLVSDGIDVTGPLPADTLFHDAMRRTYDAALCMYHDQALIPIKTLAFDSAVNVTLGLPFVRTSPDHGTAFDIAGTGRASPSSLVAALALAARLSQRTLSATAA